jgi:hypothetical protein
MMEMAKNKEVNTEHRGKSEVIIQKQNQQKAAVILRRGQRMWLNEHFWRFGCTIDSSCNLATFLLSLPSNLMAEKRDARRESSATNKTTLLTVADSSVEQKNAPMVLIYGEALSNAGAARRLYMERFPGRQVPCVRTFVNAVQHLRDYGTFILSTEIEAVQDLGVSWTWSLKFCKLLTKNRMLVADDLHYEWVFPVSQFGERCTNKDYILIIFTVSNT